MNIYETCVLMVPHVSEADREKLISSVKSAVEEQKGEMLITDEWGAKKLAQATPKGLTQGFYTYFLYKAPGEVNKEVERRLRINETVIKHIMVKAGEEAEQEKVVKAYKTPYASSSAHRPSEEELATNDKDKRLFAKKKACYFTSNKLTPDWKNPLTYRWLVNEFGKISPARVSGLTSKFQRSATTSIKRARCIGLISHLNSRTAL